MSVKKNLKNRIKSAILGVIFAFISIFTPILTSTPVHAEIKPDEYSITGELQDLIDLTPFDDDYVTDPVVEEEKKQEEAAKKADQLACKKQLGSISWLVCPAMEAIAKATDSIYSTIKDLLNINPLDDSSESPVHKIWSYLLNFTNIVFIIFLLVVVFSQVTGIGINNYGIKKALPKLLIMAILVNLSFHICALMVDVSNIVGQSLRGLFESVAAGIEKYPYVDIAIGESYDTIASGSAIALLGVSAIVESGALWMLIPTILSALAAVVSGLITIALRQAVVILLVMVSPLALVCYVLPNTEDLYRKWKNTLKSMLIFYPMFSLLYGASNLAGWALMSSANGNVYMVILGLAVQITPLIASWSLMKMSGTVLGTINQKIRSALDKPIAVNRNWASSHMLNTRANYMAHGISPSSRLNQYLENRRILREIDTKNAQSVIENKGIEYAQRKIAGSAVGSIAKDSKQARASHYTKTAKMAGNYKMIASNATSHAEHVISEYGNYFDRSNLDKSLGKQAQQAWLDYGRAAYVRELDEENDIDFLVAQYLKANARDENNNPKDRLSYDRYVRSVVGVKGQERLIAKVIAQAARVESKQRSEFAILHAKYGHNGYNKQAFRSWLAGYYVNDDGWAVDKNGERLTDENGNKLEKMPGEILSTPELRSKMVLYDKRDEKGLYYDMKDQDGNIIARVHRGKGADGENHDDAAFIKETASNYDIPIGDPINNLYGILSGITPGSIETPQGQNDIGLSRYSTTIGRAMATYKGNASWAGSMFNSGIGNRQIKNSAQYALWVLDSIVKTLKPGAFNTQNPASVAYINTLFNPDNWDEIFDLESIKDAVNINNKPLGGEDWDPESVEIFKKTRNYNDLKPIAVDNPTYEQMMNKIKRKYLFPAMTKVMPSFDRLMTSNTADNQKPGTADEQTKLIQMFEEKWLQDPNLPDPTLVDQDLPGEARALRGKKHDKNGNILYPDKRANRSGWNPGYGAATSGTLRNELMNAHGNAITADDAIDAFTAILASEPAYSRALIQFEDLVADNPGASLGTIQTWIDMLAPLV